MTIPHPFSSNSHRRKQTAFLPVLLALAALLPGAACSKNARPTASQQGVAAVQVRPSSGTIARGSRITLTATPVDAGGRAVPGRVVVWSSSNPAAATVDAGGLVTAEAVGTATITATTDGKNGTAALTVMEPPPPGASITVVGAGDIAACGGHAEETAQLIDGIVAGSAPGSVWVFTTGDNAYPDGTDTDFSRCYDPTWGRHKAITWPSPGNHDYHTAGAAGYFNYFGANAGDPAKGYYSYDLADWHFISLNSSVDMSAGSPQERWLREDLAQNTRDGILAYWHFPRFSSGTHGSSTEPQALWQALYEAGAEIIVVGHDHNYQRFAPQTPDGTADPARGIRQFVVGTGGAGLYVFGSPIANSETHDYRTHGVLKLTLGPGSYAWEFIPVAGKTYRDAGVGTCHR